ncbi:MAG: hypothetical protein NZM07_02480, partial [Elioraea sp.]|nr:hypothetical protein [Elioraea sp.]
MLRRLLVASALLAAPGLAVPGVASTIVLSNNSAPGDSFVNAGPTNQGQAIGTTGWYYNNVRNSGSVGISTALPRNGNGSAFFSSPSGAA